MHGFFGEKMNHTNKMLKKKKNRKMWLSNLSLYKSRAPFHGNGVIVLIIISEGQYGMHKHATTLGACDKHCEN